jgi:hypothetical protein
MRTSWLGAALVVGPLLYGVLTLAFQSAIGGSAAFSFNSPDAFDLWSGVLLLSLLPALGAAHMILSSPGKSAETVAA